MFASILRLLDLFVLFDLFLFFMMKINNKPGYKKFEYIELKDIFILIKDKEMLVEE
jgi:hypothetical protein